MPNHAHPFWQPHTAVDMLERGALLVIPEKMSVLHVGICNYPHRYHYFLLLLLLLLILFYRYS